MGRSFKQYLVETPLPDDWDKGIYTNGVSFAKRIAYAKAKAKRIGAGSSRVAFKIDYNGRPTVLKIAKNKRGIAQNKLEAEILSDHYIRGLGVVIPLIDHDEVNEDPTWLHTEFALKAKPSDFIRACGASLNDLISYVRSYHEETATTLDLDSELVFGLDSLVRNYDLPVDDFTRLANWGIYKGNPVLLDVGLSHDIFKTYY